jgi:hypothetical protein
MDYLRAVLNNDKKSEKTHLENLIKIGKELRKNTKTYQIELKKLNKQKITPKKINCKKHNNN